MGQDLGGISVDRGLRTRIVTEAAALSAAPCPFSLRRKASAFSCCIKPQEQTYSDHQLEVPATEQLSGAVHRE